MGEAHGGDSAAGPSERTAWPAAYLEGIRLFNAGEWYDAHEAWEEHWQAIGDSSRDFYKGLIQLAVAALHWERGNRNGASKLARSGRAYLRPYEPVFQGLELSAFLAAYEEWFTPLADAAAAKRAAPPLAPDWPRIVLRG